MERPLKKRKTANEPSAAGDPSDSDLEITDEENQRQSIEPLVPRGLETSPPSLTPKKAAEQLQGLKDLFLHLGAKSEHENEELSRLRESMKQKDKEISELRDQNEKKDADVLFWQELVQREEQANEIKESLLEKARTKSSDQSQVIQVLNEEIRMLMRENDDALGALEERMHTEDGREAIVKAARDVVSSSVGELGEKLKRLDEAVKEFDDI